MMPRFTKALLYFFVGWPVVVQSQAFEKTTIKPSRPADQSNMRIQVLPNGDLIASAVPAVTLITYAYDVPTNPSPPCFRSSRLDRS